MFPERKENEQNFTITKDGVEYKLPVHWRVMLWGMGRLTDGPSRWSFPWKGLRKKTMTRY